MMKKFIDIGVNLTDSMYQGIYHGSKKHDPDLDGVLERAWGIGMYRMIITGGSLNDSIEAIELAKKSDNLFSTVGCHPTKCNEFDSFGPDKYYLQLSDTIKNNSNKVVAIGECGLDYDRTNFCDKETQKKYFRQQLKLSNEFKLPLFLHCRNAAGDLLEILNDFPDITGVVHSFDGTKHEAESILSKGLFIGINGCSLKTSDNLSVASSIPDNFLLLETDAPWCEVRPSHAGFNFIKTTFPSVKKEKWQPNCLIKSRNEPVTIVQILEILSALKCCDPDKLSEQILTNTEKLFFSNL